MNRGAQVIENVEEDASMEADVCMYNMWLKASLPAGAARMEMVWDRMRKKGVYPDLTSFGTRLHGMALEV